MEKFDWLEVQLFLREELKFVSTMPGVVSVTTTGVLPVPASSVASWDFSELVSAMYYLSYTMTCHATETHAFPLVAAIFVVCNNLLSDS